MSTLTPLIYDEKKLIVCPECQSHIPEASEYCPYCGIQLKALKNSPELETEKELKEGTPSKELEKKRIRKKNVYLLLGVIGFLTALSLLLINAQKLNKGKIQIPIESSGLEGSDPDVVYKELEEAGFENITKKQDDSGWLKEGEVTHVTIGGTDTYKKDDYRKPDEEVIIYYSSEGRIDAEKYLSNWENINYEVLIRQLQKAGFTNVNVGKELVTYEKEKNLLVASLILNGRNYKNGECYLKPDSSIVVSYYKHMIKMSEKSSKYVGKDYESVVGNFKAMGFINITLKRADNLKIGVLKKEGEIYSISIDGKTKFKKNDEFYYDAPIEIIVNTYKGKGCEDITVIAY